MWSLKKSSCYQSKNSTSTAHPDVICNLIYTCLHSVFCVTFYNINYLIVTFFNCFNYSAMKLCISVFASIFTSLCSWSMISLGLLKPLWWSEKKQTCFFTFNLLCFTWYIVGYSLTIQCLCNLKKIPLKWQNKHDLSDNSLNFCVSLKEFYNNGECAKKCIQLILELL